LGYQELAGKLYRTRSANCTEVRMILSRIFEVLIFPIFDLDFLPLSEETAYQDLPIVMSELSATLQ